MTIAEVIGQLEALMLEHGNIRVYVAHGPAASKPEKITFIPKMDEYKMILEMFSGAGVIFE